jgi:hypothetical protein
MNPTEDLEKRIRRLRVETSAVVDRRILADASAALENRSFTLIDANRPSVWRNIMRSKWTKLAAVLLAAATLGTITFHRQIATVAYALEQTLEANLGLRTIHILIEPAGKGLSEAWAQFDEDGNLLRLRMTFPNTEDGAKEVVWQEDKAEVWFKTKKGATVVHEKEMLKRIPEMLSVFDPKVAMEQLHEAQSKGKVVIETQGPSAEEDSISLVVSFKDAPDKRAIYRIHPQTKLVKRIEKYRLVDDQWKSVSRHEYLEYNQEIPSEIFVLDIPADVTRVDTTTQEVGLFKGDLTDDQIAVKVAQEFFEALIVKDYGRAGVVYSGMPASKMEEIFGKMEFLRILSIGDPTPHPDVRTQFLQVPCEVELRVEGQTHVKKFMPNIRAVYNQPNRWAIGGGI